MLIPSKVQEQIIKIVACIYLGNKVAIPRRSLPGFLGIKSC